MLFLFAYFCLFVCWCIFLERDVWRSSGCLPGDTVLFSKTTLTGVGCMSHHILSHVKDIITPPSWNAFPDLICNEEEEQLTSKNLGSFVHISLKMQVFRTRSRESVFLCLNPSSTTSKLSPLPLVNLSAPAVGVQVMGVRRAEGSVGVRERTAAGHWGWSLGRVCSVRRCCWPCCPSGGKCRGHLLLIKADIKRFGKCKTLSLRIDWLWKVVNFH